MKSKQARQTVRWPYALTPPDGQHRMFYDAAIQAVVRYMVATGYPQQREQAPPKAQEKVSPVGRLLDSSRSARLRLFGSGAAASRESGGRVEVEIPRHNATRPGVPSPVAATN